METAKFFSIYREKKSHSIYSEWVKCVTRTGIRKTRAGILRIAEKIYPENTSIDVLIIKNTKYPSQTGKIV